MEKKYCAHCKNLQKGEEQVCSTCGNSEFKEIIIAVHNQQSSPYLTNSQVSR
jgi:RNA polymerase subunit RPABC4/transcription elongation factor Spt4